MGRHDAEILDAIERLNVTLKEIRDELVNQTELLEDKLCATATTKKR